MKLARREEQGRSESRHGSEPAASDPPKQRHRQRAQENVRDERREIRSSAHQAKRGRDERRKDKRREAALAGK